MRKKWIWGFLAGGAVGWFLGGSPGISQKLSSKEGEAALAPLEYRKSWRPEVAADWIAHLAQEQKITRSEMAQLEKRLENQLKKFEVEINRLVARQDRLLDTLVAKKQIQSRDRVFIKTGR